MPITSHTLTQNTQADGSTSNTLRMYDQDGMEYLQTFFAPAGFDVSTKVSNTILELDEQLATNEFEALIGAANA
jgi:predicted RNA-binding protein Jag